VQQSTPQATHHTHCYSLPPSPLWGGWATLPSILYETTLSSGFLSLAQPPSHHGSLYKTTPFPACSGLRLLPSLPAATLPAQRTEHTPFSNIILTTWRHSNTSQLSTGGCPTRRQLCKTSSAKCRMHHRHIDHHNTHHLMLPHTGPPWSPLVNITGCALCSQSQLQNFEAAVTAAAAANVPAVLTLLSGCQQQIDLPASLLPVLK